MLPERQYVQQEETGRAKHIFKLERHLNTSLSKKVTLQSVAEYMHLSTRQVERIVEREYGCTLAQLVADKKLASAERMLKNSDMSIDKIAEAIAFGGSYFYTIFKKKYAMTPLQYRKQYQKTTQ
jgi:transcriptional regulator GlxA family with amidase domain